MNLRIPFWPLIIVSEIALALTFLVTAYIYDKEAKVDLRSIGKGIVERGFLTVCLVCGYPHALTLFGTLKLATRLKRDDNQDSKKFNDYYLLGNLVSVVAAVLYSKYYPTGIQ